MAMMKLSRKIQRRRYQSLRLEEASEPDLWMQVHHFHDDDPENEDEADMQVETSVVGFETLSENPEVALLMTLQKFLCGIHSYGRFAAWTAVRQLKQLLKFGILQDRRDLVYNGLKSLAGDVTSNLDEEVWGAVYEPRISYVEDFGDLTRALCQRYFMVHGFEEENLFRDVLKLAVIRDLDFAAVEAAQLQKDRGIDPMVENTATTSFDEQLIEMESVRARALSYARQREQAEVYSEQEAMWRWDDEIDMLTLM